MSVKVLSTYIKVCRKFKKEPSWEGLKIFCEVIK